MSYKFFADKVLKFVMYRKGLKNKMLVFAILDFFFQMSLIGLVITIIMLVLRETSLTNIGYTLLVSVIGGAVSAYFDVGKVKKGKLEIDEPGPNDTRDAILIFAAIAVFFAALAGIYIYLKYTAAV